MYIRGMNIEPLESIDKSVLSRKILGVLHKVAEKKARQETMFMACSMRKSLGNNSDKGKLLFTHCYRWSDYNCLPLYFSVSELSKNFNYRHMLFIWSRT